MGPLHDEYYDFVLQGSGPDYPLLDVALAKRITYRILQDMRNRRGLRQQWEQIDEDVQEEIIAAWIDLAETEIQDDIQG